MRSPPPTGSCIKLVKPLQLSRKLASTNRAKIREYGSVTSAVAFEGAEQKPSLIPHRTTTAQRATEQSATPRQSRLRLQRQEQAPCNRSEQQMGSCRFLSCLVWLITGASPKSSTRLAHRNKYTSNLTGPIPIGDDRSRKRTRRVD